MFEWLEHELAVIKTPEFHLVDGPADPKLEEAVVGSTLPLPAAYKDFVRRFGNAKLYRRAPSSYLIHVFAGPRETTLLDGTPIYHIGFNDGAIVYVKPASEGHEGSIFEFELNAEDRVSDDFETWLAASCAHVRGRYGKEKWEEILRGPEPFGPDELEVIEARRRIRWRVVGIDGAGNHVLEVLNGSDRVLPVLTVGVRSRDHRLNGAVWLSIGHIGPGASASLHVDCYKDLVRPGEIEVFDMPDPTPIDREQYRELG